MSDPKTTPADPAAQPEHHVARVGHVDAGELVQTEGGELIPGIVADIADGDDHGLWRRHPKAKAEHAAEEHHVAKVGHKDRGEIVQTAGGELIDGRVADISDGDD